MSFISEEKDSELIAQAVQGDDKAFRSLVVRYSPLVYNYTCKMIPDRTTAEDVTQEIFLKVYQNLARFDRERAFKPWLLRIASNAAISYHRRSKARVQPLSMDALQETEPLKDWHGPHSADPANILEGRELSDTAKKAILQLEERYRDALQLRYVQDLSYAEIADVKGIPMNTVKTWIKRGKQMLQNQLKGLSS